MYGHYEHWKAEALRLGYTLELDGAGNMIAHLDGEEKGLFNGTLGYFY